MDTNVSEKHSASFFKVEVSWVKIYVIQADYKKGGVTAGCSLQSAYMTRLLNVGIHRNYTVSQARRK
jgi:hypothetical protein